MCTEIYVGDAEAERPGKECWCPLADCFDPKDRERALAQLGLAVYEALIKKAEAEPSEGEHSVSVTFKRW